jgi:hypothetical protein
VKDDQISSSPSPNASPSSTPISAAHDRAHVDADAGEVLQARRHPAAVGELAALPAEQRLGLDDVVLHPSWHADDLVDPADAGGVHAEMDDEVDAGSDRWHHEPGADVLAGEQRQGAHLHQGLARAVGVERAHPGQSSVEREEQVEALLGADLADDDPRRPHPQRLLHEVAQRDPAGALEPGLAGLHRHPVRVVEPELVDLLARHHPVGARDRAGQAVQQRGLACLRPSGDQDVEASADAGVEEPRGCRRERAEVDEVVQPAGAQRELPDVDGGEAAGDALEDDVQPVPLGEHRIDERLADVDAPAAGLEHPLDQLLHLRGRQHRGGQLVPALPRDEHLARVVDPHLLDRGVVEVGLQRPEPGHPRHQLTDHGLRVRHRGDLPGQAALVVGADHPLRDPAYGGHLGLRVHPVAADGLPHPGVQVVEQRGVCVGVRESHPVPVPSEVLPILTPTIRTCPDPRHEPVDNA